jgi:glycosyltransferase involved in cell wall biosynthesis
MIDLCIINYNTRPLLARFLDTLHSDIHQVPKAWNLYISDNGSTDDSLEWLQNEGFKYQISAAFKNENIGYSAACNQLAAHSKGDIIALLNADVWMTSSDLFKINRIFEENPDIHILGPKQRDENGFITHAGIIGTNVEPKHRGWREYDPSDVMYRDRIDCVTVSGSAYFIRRDVWNALMNNEKYRELYPDATGAFLPTPHYYEETWCSYFARHLDYNVVYDGSVSVGHSWHASSPKPGEGFSEADSFFPISREIFRKACDYMGIERD